jgi:hypothetical protein
VIKPVVNKFLCSKISLPIGVVWRGGRIELNIVGKVVGEIETQSFPDFRNSLKKIIGREKLCYGSSGFGRVAGCSDHYHQIHHPMNPWEHDMTKTLSRSRLF